ncbi:helix-turn-helix domain-containing protein [Dysgonomonas mossii]|uniref:helix-turn-helix domain-containing protein n=1 Tax=Dysgonomonas mossii TaxID=163665 RepID=UPI003991E506
MDYFSIIIYTYDIYEALNISDEEKHLMLHFFTAIQSELRKNNDKFNEKIIVGHIELILTYCSRFFERQSLSIDDSKRGVKEKFERLLNQYFASTLPLEKGLPSVSYFADKLHLSANYFGGLIKKETGCSAREYIQSRIIDIAKERILNLDKSIVEVSLELGYKYPHHFSRLFKKKTGFSPIDYRENR